MPSERLPSGPKALHESCKEGIDENQQALSHSVGRQMRACMRACMCPRVRIFNHSSAHGRARPKFLLHGVIESIVAAWQPAQISQQHESMRTLACKHFDKAQSSAGGTCAASLRDSKSSSASFWHKSMGRSSLQASMANMTALSFEASTSPSP